MSSPIDPGEIIAEGRSPGDRDGVGERLVRTFLQRLGLAGRRGRRWR